jgi:hypothetical protein
MPVAVSVMPKRVLSKKAEQVGLLVLESNMSIYEAMAHVGWDKSDGPSGALSTFVSRKYRKAKREAVHAGAVFGSLTVSEVLPGFRVVAVCLCGMSEEMGGHTVQKAQKCTACHAADRAKLGAARVALNTERSKQFAETARIGRKYGTMVVLEAATRTMTGRIRWKCRCEECGAERLMSAIALKHQKQRHPDKCACATGKSGLGIGEVALNGWMRISGNRVRCATCSRVVYNSNCRVDRKRPCPVCHPVDKSHRPDGVPWYYYRTLAKRGKRFTITLEQLDAAWHAAGGRCALSGLPISFKDKTASVDRINSDVGYEAGNCQWVHKAVNKMKLDHSETVFVELCRAVVEHYNSKQARRARRRPDALSLPFVR